MSTNAADSLNVNTLGLSDEDILTIAEVATWLDVKQSWVRSHANRRRQPHLPSLKLGKYRRFKRGAIRQFLLRLEAEGVAQ